MTLNTHARCDWCEEVLIAEDEDEVTENGWLIVKFGDESLDFCTLSCVTKWSTSDSAVKNVADANNSMEDE